LVLNQVHELTQRSEAWNAIKDGRPIRGETSRDEFLEWLEKTGFGEKSVMEKIRDGSPTPEEDELGYAMRFWLYELSRKHPIDWSGGDEYLFNKLGYYDPVPNKYRKAAISYVGTYYDSDSEEFSLTFAQ